MPVIGTPTMRPKPATQQPPAMPRVERFLYWIRERTNIHLRRRAGQPKPWTVDLILQEWFFTTPFREWDKTTACLREHVRDPLADDPAVLFAVIAFRWFNLPSTGELLHSSGLLAQWDTGAARRLLHAAAECGQQVFGGAYRICPPMLKGDSKIDAVCDLLEGTWKQRHTIVTAVERCRTLEQAWQRLTMLPGVGPFTAYEFVSDLRWTYLLRDAADKVTWANAGPGAARGMNRLLGRPVKDTCWDWLPQARKLLVTVQRRLERMPKPHPFEMREVEHSLCEWDKYERARLGDGHMKRKYPGLPTATAVKGRAGRSEKPTTAAVNSTTGGRNDRGPRGRRDKWGVGR